MRACVINLAHAAFTTTNGVEQILTKVLSTVLDRHHHRISVKCAGVVAGDCGLANELAPASASRPTALFTQFRMIFCVQSGVVGIEAKFRGVVIPGAWIVIIYPRSHVKGAFGRNSVIKAVTFF